MTGPLLRTSAAALAVWLASACGPNTDPDTDVDESGGVYLLKETEAYTGDVGGMGVSGRLGMVAGTCLGFRSQDRETLLVFPPGTTLSGETAEELTVEVGGVRLHLGDHFEAGAREGASPLSDYGDLSEQAPEACRGLPAMPVDEFGS